MLEQQLDTQLTLLQQLSTLLDQERLLLEARDINELEKVIEQKQSLLQEVANQDKLIADNSAEHQRIQDGGDLFSHRQTLETLLESCKKKNEVNGKAIQLSLESNHRFGNLLNNVLNRNNMTYDQSGKTQTTRHLGKGFTA